MSINVTMVPMIAAIQKNLERTLRAALVNCNRQFRLSTHAPVLYASLRAFLKNGGKRVRPLLLIISYHGYAAQSSPSIYHGAAGFELLHSCSLIHDDIIDNARLRRGRHSLHEYFRRTVNHERFSGKDLALVVGDILYSLGLHEFLKMRVPTQRKLTTLTLLLQAATYTGIGEFKELLATTKPLAAARTSVYSLYDLKTGMYTFCYPLLIGAVLGHSPKKEHAKLMRLGTILGRAFQIQNDINDYRITRTQPAHATCSDIESGKPTIPLLIMHASLAPQEKRFLKQCLTKKQLTARDKRTLARFIQKPAVRQRLRTEIERSVTQAQDLIDALAMKPRSKEALHTIMRRLLY